VVGSTARDWYARVLASIALPGGTRDDRAWALVRGARLANLTGDFSRARTLLDEADVLFDELGDGHGAADAIGTRAFTEVATGNYDRGIELAERLTALTQSLEEADPAAAAARTRTPSEAQDVLAWALLGRALAEDDRAAAERGRAWFAAKAEAGAGTLLEQAAELRDLSFSLFVLEAYSESIETGQRALGKLLEFEATLETESGWLVDALFIIGLSLCGKADASSGISLVSAARRMYREDGIAEEDFTQKALSRIEKSARAALGDVGYEAAVRSGEAMSRDDAVELAMGIAPD
jgi:tetratricopeptide (TPR) repeat protein